MSDTAKPTEIGSELGPNTWLIDEMYRRYLEAPDSVSPTWREYFGEFTPAAPDANAPSGNGTPAPNGTAAPADAPATPAAPAPAPVTAATSASRPTTPPAQPARPPATAEEGEPLRGAAARIVANMEASLGVPTATSVRTVPAKVLEENRRLLNRAIAGRRSGKVSFTHLIGWAVVKAAVQVPSMNAGFVELDGKPAVVRHEQVNFGLAVDLRKSDGSRTLVVPNVKDAGAKSFPEWLAAYEDLIRRSQSNKLTPDDFAGTTMSLTNPGMIGTVHSVPRLMPGQGCIVGAGSLDWPVEFKGADPGTLAELGVSKVMTLTSTYDHRIIQGAESGEFLRWIEQYLLGEHGFYEEVFAGLGVHHEPARWRTDNAATVQPTDTVDPALEKAGEVLRLMNMYRVRGHLVADVNPLESGTLRHKELDPATYGLTVWDLDRVFPTWGLAGSRAMTLRQIVDVLRDSYCGSVGIEYMHIQDPEERRWIQERVEGVDTAVSVADQRRILAKLNAAEAFEAFLKTKYVGHKRFGLEGAESAIPMLDDLCSSAADAGMTDVVIGMAHRGRLNVLANIIGRSYRQIFREFEGDIDPDTVMGSGDVKYHKGCDGEHVSPSGGRLDLTLASNPSHLEAVDPVVEGIARAKQSVIGPTGHHKVLPVLVHGDAAFAGQGVVAETLNLSQLPGYRTGGTVHLVINNGIGFTTAPEDARSTFYATDVAKMVQAPVFHVNGDDPEACVRVMRLAFAYRQAFHKDVVIDMICYRRHGHNEADEPSYTQPRMYEKIEARRSVRKLYTERLVNRGDITVEEAEAALEEFKRLMQSALEDTRQEVAEHADVVAIPQPPAMGVLPHVATGVDTAALDEVTAALSRPPDGFHVHPKLERFIEDRSTQLQRDAVDWALGEALAFGTLLAEGHTVRLSGQDSRRGTFSQRHLVFTDHVTEETWTPLARVASGDAHFRVFDSLLSEYAALGFEYGYSVERPDALVMWEAQFGDFNNGAQIIIDQFIAAAEDKWQQTSGLVMLLPHGYEGQGPEHSSARLERFLQLCAEDNLQVVVPTTPAQYFHALRRQLHREVRKPLVALTPKSLLRLPAARSAAADFATGRSFEEVVGDTTVDPARVTSLLLCSGKVYYDLAARRTKLGRDDVAIVRVEQLYPFPAEALRAVVRSYAPDIDVCWVQEEPDNMGAWTHVRVRRQRFLGADVPLRRVARAGSGSPATGSAAVHAQELERLLVHAFDPSTAKPSQTWD